VWEKAKEMRISRQPPSVHIMIDQKRQENVECFKNFGSVITRDIRCTLETKFRFVMTKAEFNKKKTLLSRNVALSFSKKPIKCYIWSIVLCDTEIRF
jgi:hypothetical protein